MSKTCLYSAEVAKLLRTRAGDDSLHTEDVPFVQIFIERHFGAPVARRFAQFFDDETAHVRRAAFLIEGIGSVVTDQRISHGHDLAAIGGISQHFLITGHGGVETNFAYAGAGCAK